MGKWGWCGPVWGWGGGDFFFFMYLKYLVFLFSVQCLVHCLCTTFQWWHTASGQWQSATTARGTSASARGLEAQLPNLEGVSRPG